MFVSAMMLALALEVTEPSRAQPAPACDNRSVGVAWQPGLDAYRRDDASTAKMVTDQIITSCGDGPATFGPRIMRAEIALKEGDADTGLKVLAPVKLSGGALASLGGILRIQLNILKKDGPASLAARQDLLAASGKALTNSPVRGKFRETFRAGQNTVSVYDAKFSQQPFTRFQVFLISPDDPLAMPSSVMLGTDPTDALLGGGSTTYFVDAYDCGTHSTLDMTSGKPNYQKVKATVTAWLTNRGSAVSSTVKGASAGCAWPSFIAPGLD